MAAQVHPIGMTCAAIEYLQKERNYLTTTFLPPMMLMPFCGAVSRWQRRL